jgi:hypothetical protein
MTCPCGGDLDYKGIAESKKGTYHRIFKCDTCGKTLKENPGVSNPEKLLQRPIYKKAINLYEAFNMKPMDQVYMQKLSLPSNKNPLVYLGKLAGILYTSDKESAGRKGKDGVAKMQTYIHECKSDYPDFYVTSDGKTFIISGGRMHIPTKGKYRGWLVD